MQDRSTRRSTPRKLLPAGGRSRPSTHSVLALATLLTALVIGVVPAVALHADVHPIVVLGVALGAYGLLAVATGEVASGAVASIPVLATVNADVPLWEGPNHTVELAVVLADVGVLAGAGIVAVELLGRRGERADPPPRWRALRRRRLPLRSRGVPTRRHRPVAESTDELYDTLQALAGL